MFEDFALAVVEGSWNFIAKAGESVLYVVEQIKIAFDDLVGWLGF